MSDTPETRAVWKRVKFMAAHQAKVKLRKHAKNLEKERNDARLVIALLERERDEARELADDESKWAKQYFKERNEARQVADHLHMDLLLLHEEHGINEPKELPWMK